MKKGSQRPLVFALFTERILMRRRNPIFIQFSFLFTLKTCLSGILSIFQRFFPQQYKFRVLDLTSTLRLRSVLLLKCTFQLALDLWKWKWAVKGHANDFEVIIKSSEQINDVIIFNAFQERSTLITTEAFLREI